MASKCDFPASYEDKAIQDQIVEGIKDKNISEKLQINSDLTLSVAVKIGRQAESVKNQHTAMEPSESVLTTQSYIYDGENKNQA